MKRGRHREPALPEELTKAPKRFDGGPALAPVLFALALFMLATGRWGSYIHVPDVRFFIGDALLAVALGIAAWRVVGGGLNLRISSSPPYVLRWTGLLLTWALMRFLMRPEFSFAALRDLAPFAYATTALLAYVAPVREARWTAPLVYGALTFHVAWFITSAQGWVESSRLLALGPRGVTLFSTRPDFDATVFAIAVGLALHTLLFTRTGLSWPRKVGLTGFLAVNAWGVLLQHTRAGLLACLAVVGVVLAVWAREWSRQRHEVAGPVRRGLPLFVAAAVVAFAVLALFFTLPGQRLLVGFTGSGGESAGTTSARAYVYKHLSDYLLDEPARAVIGVGFGPDFLLSSGTLQVLEGTTYDDVRSPHNYLLGVWARLGIVGAFLAGLMLLTGVFLALRCLPVARTPEDLLAALVLFAVPVPAMLGVILESPFGALPYFWALGHLASRDAALGASRRRATLGALPVVDSGTSLDAHRPARGLWVRRQP